MLVKIEPPQPRSSGIGGLNFMVNFFTPVALIVPSSSILKASIVTLSAEVIVLPASKVKVRFSLLFASAVAVKLL